MWTDFIYGIGSLSQKFFLVMPLIGNKLNYLLIIFGFVAIGYWMLQLKSFNNK